MALGLFLTTPWTEPLASPACDEPLGTLTGPVSQSGGWSADCVSGQRTDFGAHCSGGQAQFAYPPTPAIIRAFYTTPEQLGECIVVDYMRHKRARLGRGRQAS